jgi:NAD(P)-dependent dehydrogenase (short-subunit alcohol dehydrogenase family)
MRVLLAGATGAIGRPLIRGLRQHGHSVFGLVRSAESAQSCRAFSNSISARARSNGSRDERSQRNMDESNAWTYRQFTSTIRNNERASYNGSIEASQASDVGSIPIARSIVSLDPTAHLSPGDVVYHARTCI